MTTGTDELLLEARDGVATVTLNRPEHLNALNTSLTRRLVEVFAALDRDQRVRVVCLASSGERAFCAGADLKEEAVEPAVPMTGPMRNVYEAVLECR